MTVNALDTQMLASDLAEVHRIYTELFAGLTAADWERPVKGGDEEWNLREVVAHVGALAQLGQQSIQAALRGEAISFPGLPTRFEFSQFNRQQIAERLHLPVQDLCAALLDALCEAMEMARTLRPAELARTVALPIYNRPVSVRELLAIQVMHPGQIHAAQVAEPAGVPPLWTQFAPDMRHRMIGRVMHAQSILYRQDLGGDMRAVLAYRVGGEGGGSWYITLSPEDPCAAEGDVAQADLSLFFRDTATFCRMSTGRLNLLLALLSGRLRPRGNLRLFLRLGSLFSVDATR